MAEETKNMPTVDGQYQRLIEARNFHYENLNRWLITFYAIIGALFLAFYTLYSKEAKTEVEIIVAIVGYIVSIAALLSIKGYFYWEYNWIEKLYRFEKNVLGLKGDEQVYSSIINKEKHDIPYCPVKSANVSTTKVALFVTFGVAVAWGFIIGMLGFDMEYKTINILMAIGISILLSYILMIAGARALHSELDDLDELPGSKDLHKTYYAKAVCITIAVLVVIATFFVTMGYLEGKGDSNSEEISTIISDTITAKNQVQEPIELVITIKQQSETQSHQDVWFGIIGSLLGAIIGAFLGWWLTTLSDKCKERKRKEQYVKEIQLITGAVLQYTELCNKAIQEYCDDVLKEPYKMHQLNQGILTSIQRLSRMDATLVYDAFEYKNKKEDFNTFLNRVDQLQALYESIYYNYETHGAQLAATNNEFKDVTAFIVRECAGNMNPIIQQIITNYQNLFSTSHMHIDNNQVYTTLIEPLKIFFASNKNIPLPNIYGSVERADYLYRLICGNQTNDANTYKGTLNNIIHTIRKIEEIKL